MGRLRFISNRNRPSGSASNLEETSEDPGLVTSSLHDENEMKSQYDRFMSVSGLPSSFQHEADSEYSDLDCESSDLDEWIKISKQLNGRCQSKCTTKKLSCKDVKSEKKKVLVKKLVKIGPKKSRFVTCDICKIATSRQNLSRHMKLHVEKLTCDVPNCQKVFQSADSLKRHKLNHSDPSRIFVCSICMIRCLTSTLLKQHQTLAHKICEGSNSDEADEIHTGERRFECKECFRAYKEGYKLKAHYDTMHKDSKYREDFKQEWGSALTCPICKKQFETAFIHQSHLQTHSANDLKSYSSKYFTHVRIAEKSDVEELHSSEVDQESDNEQSLDQRESVISDEQPHNEDQSKLSPENHFEDIDSPKVLLN